MSRIALYSRNLLSCLRKNGTVAETEAFAVTTARESHSNARTNPRARVLKLCA